MKLTKSSRHSKITGDFGEAIVLYLLSRHGFECARVDHTGIDLIARRPNSKEVLGISVKSRSRQTGTENSHLALSAASTSAVNQRLPSWQIGLCQLRSILI
jgi:Holliday junction resolvase-like predicted endonuclease